MKIIVIILFSACITACYKPNIDSVEQGKLRIVFFNSCMQLAATMQNVDKQPITNIVEKCNSVSESQLEQFISRAPKD